MFTASRVESFGVIEPLYSLGNGTSYYNYDIVEKQEICYEDPENIHEVSACSYIPVLVEEPVTAEKCYEAVLKCFKNEEGISLYDSDKNEESDRIAERIQYKIKVDLGLEEEISELDWAKRYKIKQITEYDTSPEVNSFFLNGVQVWLDKSTRVGLMNSLNIEKNAGKEESTLWFNNICITINCDAAIQMLSALELYALNCYNVTAEHKVAVEGLTTLEQALNYDYTVGYPDKLNFAI